MPRSFSAEPASTGCIEQRRVPMRRGKGKTPPRSFSGGKLTWVKLPTVEDSSRVQVETSPSRFPPSSQTWMVVPCRPPSGKTASAKG